MTIYGFGKTDPEKLKLPFSTLAKTPDEWRDIFDESLQVIRTFLAAHDCVEVLAKCVNQAMTSSSYKKENPRWFEESSEPYLWLDRPELEIIQALSLMQVTPRKAIPASPGSMYRFLSEAPKCTYSFIRMQPVRYPDNPEREQVIRKIRMQTMAYRNIFVKEDCESVVRTIFHEIDALTVKEVGFAFSGMFTAFLTLSDKIQQRLQEYQDWMRNGYTAKSESEAMRSVDFFCTISSVARRAWAKCKRHCNTLDDFRWAAFQLSEICHAWPYMLDKAELKDEFGEEAVAFFERVSLHPGELSSANPEHFFMNNPVWKRPFIALDENTLFLPIHSLIYSFPFQVFEQFIVPKSTLDITYSDTRAKFLEDKIETIISTAMPSAKIYTKVMWRDDTTGKEYENDVVVLIGNTIFLFEAKSGKLFDASRRGGEKSLLKDFKALFIEPGQQAHQLERYINTKGKNARLWIKGTNTIVHLDLEKPKVVHKFSICIEHFAALTSAKHNLKIMDAIKDENAWAPVISLGELMLISRYLDTEVSFFHYLTRRATLEESIDFEGDEQDILSMYLTNGLWIDSKKMQGRQLRFLNIDGVVRTDKKPRQDRTTFKIYGVPLGDYWLTSLKEIYIDTSLRHRFDIIQVILNQDPYALEEIAQHVQQWKAGIANKMQGDILLVRNVIGKRNFVMAYYLSEKHFSAEEWADHSRTIAAKAAAAFLKATDCAVILRIKESTETTYDGISFYRFTAN